MNDALPRSCVPVPKIEDDCYDWWARHERKVADAKTKHYKLVFFGDSLTHFWSMEDGVGYGEGHFERTFGPFDAADLGFGFDRTQNVLWRIEHGELDGQSPALFVINIGTNQFSDTERYPQDTPEDAAAGIECVVNLLHEKFPSAHIVLMALFPRKGKTDLVDATNAILHAKEKSLPVDALIDLTDKLSTPDHQPIPEYCQPDGCHLRPAAYEIWTDAIMPYVKKYV